MDQPFEERRCVEMNGRKACVSMENDFWECIEEIAALRGTTLDCLVAQIGGNCEKSELSATLRVFVLAHFRHEAGLAALDLPDTNADACGMLSEMPDKSSIH